MLHHLLVSTVWIICLPGISPVGVLLSDFDEEAVSLDFIIIIAVLIPILAWRSPSGHFQWVSYTAPCMAGIVWYNQVPFETIRGLKVTRVTISVLMNSFRRRMPLLPPWNVFMLSKLVVFAGPSKLFENTDTNWKALSATTSIKSRAFLVQSMSAVPPRSSSISCAWSFWSLLVCRRVSE